MSGETHETVDHLWMVGFQELFFLVLICIFEFLNNGHTLYLSLKKKVERDGVILRVEKDFHTQIIPTWIKGFVQTSSLSN